MPETFLIKLHWNFIKKSLWHRRFLVNFAKFPRTPFLQNTYSGCFCRLNLDSSLPLSWLLLLSLKRKRTKRKLAQNQLLPMNEPIPSKSQINSTPNLTLKKEALGAIEIPWAYIYHFRIFRSTLNNNNTWYYNISDLKVTLTENKLIFST